jgi:hypothetical protein
MSSRLQHSALPQVATPNSLRLITVRLQEILGEHEMVTKLRQEAGAYFLGSPLGQLTTSGLIDLVHHRPLYITAKGGKYWCISGFRIFWLLQAALPRDTQIPVLFLGRIRPTVLRDFILYELLLVPAIQTLHPHDKRLMGKLWQARKDSEVFKNSLQSTGAKGLARLRPALGSWEVR